MSRISEINDYWTARAEGFSLRIKDDLADKGKGEWLSKIKPFLPASPGRALDAGCGPGFMSILLAELGWEVTGLDFSSEMLKRARENAESAGLKIGWLEGDAQNPPLAEGSFDLVISRNLTWTIEEPAKAYASWKSLLKPGGAIINCDGNHYRHLTDERYQAERESPGFDNDHDPKYMMGVDTSIIENIARDLPTSPLDRPKWDLGVLLELGAKRLSVNLDRVRFQDKNGREIEIIKDFVLLAGF